jgi:diguanylate cyclase (GGDEF)-like protein
MVKDLSLRFFVLSSIFVLLTVAFLLNLLMPSIEKRIKYELAKTISSSYETFLTNLNKDIVRKYHIKDVQYLKKHQIRKELEEILSYVVNSRIENIFILYRQGNLYRFLVDASASNKANYDDIFFPTPEENTYIEKLIKTKKMQIIFQESKDTKNIGITLLLPFIIDGKVEGITYLDFSIQTLKSIESVVYGVKIALNIIIIASIFAFLIIIFTTIKTLYFKKKAYIDELTGVYNRNYLEDLINTFDLKNFAVAMFDIDFFKKINDTYGHKAGDQVLKDFAKILKYSFREGEDFIIRYGGEEFLVLIRKDRNNKYAPLNAVKRAIERIRSFPFKVDSQILHLTSSVGVYLDVEKEKSLMEAIKKADIALYRAKLNGRNRIEIYEQEDYYTSLGRINNLIEEESIICHYQPVVNLKNRELLYFESSVRLVDNGKIIYPDNFFNIIRNTFLYSKLTKKVIDFNIKVLKKYENINISINLSPLDLVNDAVVDYLLNIEKQFIKRLKLEIIETEEIQNYSKILNNLKTLKSKRCNSRIYICP